MAQTLVEIETQPGQSQTAILSESTPPVPTSTHTELSHSSVLQTILSDFTLETNFKDGEDSDSEGDVSIESDSEEPDFYGDDELLPRMESEDVELEMD